MHAAPMLWAQVHATPSVLGSAEQGQHAAFLIHPSLQTPRRQGLFSIYDCSPDCGCQDCRVCVAFLILPLIGDPKILPSLRALRLQEF